MKAQFRKYLARYSIELCDGTDEMCVREDVTCNGCCEDEKKLVSIVSPFEHTEDTND